MASIATLPVALAGRSYDRVFTGFAPRLTFQALDRLRV